MMSAINQKQQSSVGKISFLRLTTVLSLLLAFRLQGMKKVVMVELTAARLVAPSLLLNHS